MSKTKLAVALLILGLIAAFFIFDFGQYFNFEFLKSRQAILNTYYREHPLVTAVVYTAVYIIATGLSLPGATILTLIAGAIFGLFWGAVIASVGATAGATVAFLLARFVLHDWVQSRFGERLKKINQGVKRDGAFYLFAMRLVPAFPYFIINIVMGLTPMRTWAFFWVSQVGMLPATIVYVNAGHQLSVLESPGDILSFGLIASFALIASFPFIARKLLALFQAGRVYKPFKRPKSYDRNLVVIGAGSAGLVSAYIAATVKAKVSLIEKNKMGGDCLNTGCVPSKALIRSAKFLNHIDRAREFGFKTATAEFGFADIMQRIRNVVQQIEPHDSVERYTQLGVDCIHGSAVIRSPFEIEVNGRTITTRNIIVATGARPFVPPVPGIEQTGYLTSDTLWELHEQPRRLLVLGGGPIGCELAQAFARLGSQVTQVEMSPRLLSREDPEISEILQQRFKDEGITVLTRHKAARFTIEQNRKISICENQESGEEVRIEFDQLLVAVGRKPDTRGFGLEDIGVTLNSNGTLAVNDYLQTNFPNIYACGDAAGPYQFTHTASHQAWYCAVNALFGRFKKFRVDYSVIPWATFTDPEIARVGLNETEAKERGINYEVTTYSIEELDRAIADSEAHGLVKVLTVPGKDKILGVTIAGARAGDLIAEYVAAMKHNIGLNKILGTIHIYPTFSEANKYAAGRWKHNHAPEKLLKWVQRYHTWMLK
ncbi:MAG TPA: dihydrolipoyl dehydrogenase [Gammaproteobacteria bacterium]